MSIEREITSLMSSLFDSKEEIKESVYANIIVSLEEIKDKIKKENKSQQKYKITFVYPKLSVKYSDTNSDFKNQYLDCEINTRVFTVPLNCDCTSCLVHDNSSCIINRLKEEDTVKRLIDFYELEKIINAMDIYDKKENDSTEFAEFIDIGDTVNNIKETDVSNIVEILTYRRNCFVMCEKIDN
jgi:hypothetical protein